MSDGLRWFYMRFVGEEGWLGGLYMQGCSEADVIANAWAKGLNPGGEIAIAQVPAGWRPGGATANRLLTKEEVEHSGLYDESIVGAFEDEA